MTWNKVSYDSDYFDRWEWFNFRKETNKEINIVFGFQWFLEAKRFIADDFFIN